MFFGKKEFPPLLGVGFHVMSMSDLRSLCVNQFPASKTRPKIMEGLEKVVARLTAERIQGDLWINGSFLTEKIDPKDSDVLLVVEEGFANSCSNSQYAVLDWLSKDDLKPDYLCDSYLLTVSPAQAMSLWFTAYWIKQFGFSRKEDIKGMALIQLR